jgi:hypothetical protein
VIRTGLACLVVVTAAVAAGVAGLAGCSTAKSNPAPGPGPSPGRLAATLVSPKEVKLEWKADEPDAAGRIVEYATDPDGPFTVLQFLPPTQTSFTHPDLMPDADFYYRVRTFYGPASEPVDITLPPGELKDDGPAGDEDWTAPRKLPQASHARQPIRTAATAATATAATATAAAAPTDLRGTVVDPNGITFTWADNASDEEGYLFEVKPQGGAVFRVVASLEADVNAFGLVTMPNEKVASYRVRAFYYGPASNVVHEKTGPEK